ncbi:MAG: putative C-S lyase [Chloroflexota bacterium]|nr:MAG: putative C-S lyase [Chloroflexota bacterium]
MIYNFDLCPERRGTESLKWRAYAEDVLPMWVADMDFVSPEPVLRALHERVEHGVFGYPSDMFELRQVFVERLERLYGWCVSPDDLVFVPGVVTGVNLACHALAAPGGAGLVQTPVYPPFLSAPANAGIARQDAGLVRMDDGSYQIDLDAFESAITDHTRLFVLCNPHNPVGRVFQKAELEGLAEICLRRGVVICSDEIHCDLIFSGHRHIPIASLHPEIAQNTITLMAPSKTFNIAGLKFSVAIIPNADLRKKFSGAEKGLAGWVNVMGLVAGLAAYRDGQEWLDQLLVYLETNRDCLHGYANSQLPGVKMALPEGTYLAWLDCRNSGIDGCPSEFFIKHGRVALNDGSAFGPGGDGFVRLNFGCPRGMLMEGLDRMRKALLQINS